MESIVDILTDRQDGQTTLNTICASLGEGIFITNEHLIVTHSNEAFHRLTKLAIGDTLSDSSKIFGFSLYERAEIWKDLLKEGSWEGEITICKDYGKTRINNLFISLIKREESDNKIFRCIGIINDITEKRLYETGAKNSICPSTGLPLRNAFIKKLSDLIFNNRKKKSHLPTAVLYISITHNLTGIAGIGTIDHLMTLVANILGEHSRNRDVLARSNGSTFLLLLPDLDKARHASSIAQRKINRLREPILVGDKTAQVRIQVGIAIYPDDADNADSLIDHAHLALTKIEKKEFGWVMFSQKMQEAANRRFLLETDMRTSERNNFIGFYLVYQPQLNLTTNETNGVEALLRWNHPSGEEISPLEFIPIAEETGIIIALGAWVLDKACTMARVWEQNHHPITIGVNVSAAQINESHFLETVVNTLKKTNLSPPLLELEITESMLLNDIDKVIAILHQLKKLNVRVAIDDFGTGYSSLSMLPVLPIGRIKIDRSFVKKLTQTGESIAIIDAIIKMAKSLRLCSIAEGAESNGELVILKEHGCEELQGFFHSKPIREESILPFLKQEEAMRQKASYLPN